MCIINSSLVIEKCKPISNLAYRNHCFNAYRCTCNFNAMAHVNHLPGDKSFLSVSDVLLSVSPTVMKKDV